MILDASNMDAVSKVSSAKETTQLIPRKITIDDVLDSIGQGAFQWIAVSILAIGNAADAIEIYCVSYIIENYEGEITSYEKGMLSASVFAGMFLGGILCGLGDSSSILIHPHSSMCTSHIQSCVFIFPDCL
jgi:hypothetical protein